MASQYPTPPPTSSPKHSSSYRPFSPTAPAQEIYYQTPLPETKTPTEASYYQAPFENKKPAQDSYYEATASTIPALDSYYHDSYSQPISAQPPINSEIPAYKPPRSPLIEQAPIPYDYASPAAGVKPPRRPSSGNGISPNTSPRPGYSRPGGRSPRPFFSSPTNPTPTPYNASRPSPRPGLLKRILAQLKDWLRHMKEWARENPIKTGLLSIVPVVAGAGLWKLGKATFKGVRGLWQGKMGKDGDKWAYGLEDFKGFAGSKAGPLDGFLKVIHMLMNHWCKLTPSSIPRVSSIMLELYFLEPWEKRL